VPKVSPIQTAFNAGEFSPLMYGRTDFDTYKNALKTSINGIGLIQGGWARRPGSYFVAEVKTSASATRVIPFEFSTTQAYIIEVGDLYFRFYRNNGRIETAPDVAYEIVTPYAAAHIPALRFVQSADVLYITHPLYAPRKLSRTAHTTWTLSTITFVDGPYLSPTHAATHTLTPSAATGAGITITSSTGLFAATDVGRLIRMQEGSAWGYVTITGYTSSTIVTATVGSTLVNTNPKAMWRMGAWSATTGYPAVATFFEDRLFFGGPTQYPQRIDGSRTGAYEDFTPSAPADGTVVADHAVAFTLNSNDVQVIRWMVSEEKGLLVGTTRAEWIVRPSSSGEALSPTNISAKPSTKYGSADVAAVTAGKTALFAQRAGRKLRELAYVYEVDGFRSPDMTVLSQHITRGGIREITYQQEPHSIVWVVRNDGALLAFVYERDQKVLGWHRQFLGGSGAVESVACIPSADGTRDELWMVVRRTIGGSTKRYVEYLTKVWEHGDTQEDSVHVDCALTYSGAAATTISGLGHLEGETVQLLADGATHPDCTVASGAITLDRSATKVHVGYAYNSDGQLLRPEVGAADGTAQGKTQRTHRLTFRVQDALGLKIGASFTDMTPITFRTSADLTATAVPLFSGDVEAPCEFDYTTENTPCWRFYQPLPGIILAAMPQLHTQDR
jgi:hypothetical protein